MGVRSALGTGNLCDFYAVLVIKTVDTYILLILILLSNRTYSYCIEDWVGEGISGPAGRSLYTVILIKIKMKIKMCGCMALIKSLQSRTMDEDADEEDIDGGKVYY